MMASRMMVFTSRFQEAVNRPVIVMEFEQNFKDFPEYQSFIDRYNQRQPAPTADFSTLHFSYIADAPNPWKIVAESAGLVAYQWCIVALIVVATVLAMVRYIQFYHHIGSYFCMVQICLIMDVVSLLCTLPHPLLLLT